MTEQAALATKTAGILKKALSDRTLQQVRMVAGKTPLFPVIQPGNRVVV